MLPRKITLIRAALPVNCPSCGAEISWRRADLDLPFPCPACRHGVLIRKRYLRVIGIVSLVLAALIVYGIGIRGDALIPAVLLAILPTQFVVGFITLRLFPPDVDLTGDFRGILFGANASEERSTETSAAAAETDRSHFHQRIWRGVDLHGEPGIHLGSHVDVCS